jgi:chromate transporter
MDVQLPPEPAEAAPVPPPEITAPGLVTPSLWEMTLGFTTMTLQGVGGVLVFARRYIVERARWMTAQEFDEAFAFSQLLPGPNIVNFAVMYGQRHYGIVGAICGFMGILAPPVALVMVIAAVFAHFGDAEILRRVLNGTAVAAAGLLLSVVLKMSTPLAKQRSIRAGIIVVGIFVAIVVFRVPLPIVLLVALPSSIGLAWFGKRKAAAS